MALSLQPPSVHPDRQLRVMTIVAMLPAIALLISTGITTSSYLPAVGLVPMAFSCLVSAVALGGSNHLPGAGTATVNAAIALSPLGFWCLGSFLLWVHAMFTLEF